MDTSEAAEATGGTAEGFGTVGASGAECINAQDAQAETEGINCGNMTENISSTGIMLETTDTYSHTLSGYAYDPMETVSDESIQEFSAEGYQLTSEFAFEHGKVEDVAPLEETDITLCKLPDKVCGGHSMETQDVYISNELINEGARHTTNHELMHRSSNQSQQYMETETQEFTIKTSGIHALVETVNKGTNEITLNDYHRALNEGLTERYTLQMEREAYGDELECGIRAYTENMEYAATLFDIVGEQSVDNAYFNGELAPLSQQMNELLGNDHGFSEFSKNVDIACSPIDYSMPYEEVQKALEQKVEAKEKIDQMLLEIAKANAAPDK